MPGTGNPSAGFGRSHRKSLAILCISGPRVCSPGQADARIATSVSVEKRLIQDTTGEPLNYGQIRAAQTPEQKAMLEAAWQRLDADGCLSPMQVASLKMLLVVRDSADGLVLLACDAKDRDRLYHKLQAELDAAFGRPVTLLAPGETLPA